MKGGVWVVDVKNPPTEMVEKLNKYRIDKPHEVQEQQN